MITIYDVTGSCLTRRDSPNEFRSETVWIDLLDPTPEEEALVEKNLKIDVPTRAEMREIEASNRFYQEDGAHFMTSFVIYAKDADTATTSNVTFILSGQRLVTVRYGEPKAFPLFAEKACKGSLPCTAGPHIMAGLLELIVQRQADLIEKVQDEVESLAPQIFDLNVSGRGRGRRLENVLKTIGKEGDVVSRALESSTSLHRTLHYFADAARERKEDPRLISRIDVISRDITSLGDSLRSMSGRTNFLLDATLGMISNEQNQIIKLFSVMSVMLMPPTLVASVYGMNFKFMPELDWRLGYPFALALMFISALIPYIYFRRKGWL
jgi:magnesium transporter